MGLCRIDAYDPNCRESSGKGNGNEKDIGMT